MVGWEDKRPEDNQSKKEVNIVECCGPTLTSTLVILMWELEWGQE